MTGRDAGVGVEAAVIEELIRALVKALKAFQMYLPNNPMHQRAGENLLRAFLPVWEGLPELTLQVVETEFVWDGNTVYSVPTKSESLAWTLFKDGMRVLTFDPGAEKEEVGRFLDVVRRARSLPADADDDLNTLLWEEDFQLIRYRFTDFLADAMESPLPDAAGLAPPPSANEPAATEARQEQVKEEIAPRDSAIVDLEDFDSTLYFLDESEIRHIGGLLEREYSDNLREQTLNIVLDMLEIHDGDDVHVEIIRILESLLPNLLNAAEFKAVAMILRELRVIGERRKTLTPEQRARMDQFRAIMSDPAVLTQLLQAVDEATAAPSEIDLGELFRELRPQALETILIWLPRITSPTMQDLLVASAERLAESYPAQVVELLKQPDSDALAGTVELAGRLELQGAVPGLGETLTHSEAGIRVATVKALAAIGSAGALSHLEKALDDKEREVRVYAVRALGARGYRNVLARVETAVSGRGLKGADLSERIAYFEAYALIAGPSCIPVLRDMVLPRGFLRRNESAQTRACAAMAIARLNAPEAREVLQLLKNDKELLVRNAANRGLREMKQ